MYQTVTLVCKGFFGFDAPCNLQFNKIMLCDYFVKSQKIWVLLGTSQAKKRL